MSRTIVLFDCNIELNEWKIYRNARNAIIFSAYLMGDTHFQYGNLIIK